MSITVTPDGNLKFIWDDRLDELKHAGEFHRRRASYVESAGTQWTADMSPVGGPLLGPFELHKYAISAETAWLEGHGF